VEQKPHFRAQETTIVKRRGPKVKLARQLGIALTPKAAKVMENRPNPPGQHGATPKRKISGYKKQLIEKQRLRAQYNVSERQMENSFVEATRQTGNTGVRLLQLLEMRLDAVVLRGGFVRTIYGAKGRPTVSPAQAGRRSGHCREKPGPARLHSATGSRPSSCLSGAGPRCPQHPGPRAARAGTDSGTVRDFSGNRVLLAVEGCLVIRYGLLAVDR
jgi:hypothetical protein